MLYCYPFCTFGLKLMNLCIKICWKAFLVVFIEYCCFAVSKMVTWTGKCIPITRGGGIYQEHMNEALERLNDGEWVSM